MARKHSKYNRRRARGRFAFLYKLLIFALICGAISFALALFFKVEVVQITDNVRYSEEQILSASGIQIGDNLFLMNKFNIAENITSTLPYVETVQIRRQIPTALQISVTECTAPAAIRQDGKVWLISGEGKLIDCVSLSVWKNYPQISGITLTDPALGQPVTVPDEEAEVCDRLFSLLHLLEQKEMLSDVQAIHLEDSTVMTLRYLDRFDVIWNYDADFDYKLDYLRAVIQRLEGNEVGSIDMTQNDKVSFIPA